MLARASRRVRPAAACWRSSRAAARKECRPIARLHPPGAERVRRRSRAPAAGRCGRSRASSRGARCRRRGPWRAGGSPRRSRRRRRSASSRMPSAISPRSTEAALSERVSPSALCRLRIASLWAASWSSSGITSAALAGGSPSSRTWPTPCWSSIGQNGGRSCGALRLANCDISLSLFPAWLDAMRCSSPQISVTAGYLSGTSEGTEGNMQMQINRSESIRASLGAW